MFCKIKSIIGNKLASLYQLTKQNSVWLLYMNLHFTKHTIDESLPLQDPQNVSISMLFQTFCLDCKLFPIINRVGIRISLLEEKSKN